MTFAKSKIAASLVACVVAALMLAPPAQAAERHTIASGHTDAFFVDTDSGTPRVSVKTGVDNTSYDPNDVSFVIGGNTYGRYEPFAPYLEHGNVGYYTASEEGDYFEPGWSAPAFRKNGFSSIRIDFTKVEGPGKIAILGNRLVDTAPFAQFLIPSDRIDEISVLSEKMRDKHTLNGFATSGIPNGTYYVDAGVSLPIFGHTHAHWFFSEAGEYRLSAKAVGVTSDGRSVESTPFITVFSVEKSELSEPPVISGNDEADAEAEPENEEDTTLPDNTAGESSDPTQPGADKETPPQGHDTADTGDAHSGENNTGYSPISDPVTFSSGHMDAFYIGSRQGKASLFLKEDVTSSTATARIPSSVTLVFVKDRYEKTGNFNGSIQEIAGYHSNASNRNMTIFSPGWSIDDYESNGFSKAAVHFSSVKGPGRIVLTGTPTLSGTLPSVLTNKSPYLTDGAILPVTGHTHGYWLFTKPGTYTLNAKSVLTKADGSGQVESPEQTYTFVVEPNPADPSVKESAPSGPNTPGHSGTPGKPNTPGTGTPGTPTPDSPGSDPSADPEDNEEKEPSLEVTTSGDALTPGGLLNVLVKSFAPNTRIDLALTALSSPYTRTEIATGQVIGADGTAQLSMRIPATLSSGMYSLSAGIHGEDPLAFAVINLAGASSPIAPPPSQPDFGPSPEKIGALTDKVELSRGHLDLFTAIAQEGALYLVVKDDSTGASVLRDPGAVTLKIGQNAFTSIEDGISPKLPKKGYFLDAGGLNQQEMLFPGWDTNGVRPHFTSVDFEILTVTTPRDAKAYMFNTKPFGGIEPAFTNGKLEIVNGAIIRQKNPAHVHTNWLFSEPGVYTMKVRAKAKAQDGKGEVVSKIATYTWKVGDVSEEPGSTDTPASPDTPGSTQTPGSSDSTDTTTPSGPSTPGDPRKPSQSGGASEQKKSAPSTPGASNGSHSLSSNGVIAGSSSSSGSGSRRSAQGGATATCFPKTQGGSGEDTLVPLIKDDRTSPGNWVDPRSLAFSIGDAGKATVPMDIGAISKGSSVWMISMSQVAGVPWIGVNTQHPSLAEKSEGTTTFALTSFSGPGKLEVFEFGRGLSPTVGNIWFSGDGNSASGSMTVAANTHVHPNWVFTEAGHYELGITMTTTAKDGSDFSGSTVLSIDVGSNDGVNDGHFDLGPSIGPAGSQTVWVDADGKPCVPSAADLAAAGLARTGASGLEHMQALVLSLLFFGGVLVVARARSRARTI